ncbi:hypothetical protein CTRI78_v007566 [Colletotrichum trifolii]|uniref:Cell wall glucanase n=1 Tax=Colletotrichum trifolii TaxID=5466 RepID=A0A4R8R5U3_COLTR|nr:hypothetical protein CTRI78_v007566 [Colletotrichum trifolii]
MTFSVSPGGPSPDVPIMTTSLSDTGSSPQYLLTPQATSSPPSTLQLGDFSKLFSLLGVDKSSSATSPKPTVNITTSASSDASRPVLFPLSECLRLTAAVAGREQKKPDPAFKLTTAANINSVFGPQLTTLLPLSPAPSSVSSEFAISSPGDFDAQEDLVGGAHLTDDSTPPSSPPTTKAETLSAKVESFLPTADRLFEKLTAKRSLPVSEQPFSARIRNSFTDHDDFVRKNYPDNYMQGVYVFGDMSNVTIGCYDNVKCKMGIAKHQPLKANFRFKPLTEIIERDRHIARRHAIGSRKPNGSEPSYFKDARAADYEVEVLRRVNQEPKTRGNGASSDSGEVYRRNRYEEQSVDETVQLRMSEAIMDYDPGIMALISGDGNDNLTGFSAGFPKFVERALNAGWVVEVYSFKSNTAFCWTSSTWLDDPRWAGRLSHHLLDPFSQDMVDPKDHAHLSEMVYSTPRSVVTTKHSFGTPMSYKQVMTASISTFRSTSYAHVKPVKELDEWATPPSKKRVPDVRPLSGYKSSAYQDRLQSTATFDVSGQFKLAGAAF